MKLKDVKNWIDNLPVDFLEFDVVNAEEGILTKDGEVLYRYDKPVVSLNVNEESKEILFLNNKPTNVN